MTKRYSEFDVLRAIALAMILACHFIQRIGFYKLDVPFGSVGNMIFFTMSGWLLGFGWNNKGFPAYGMRFLEHRLLRLAVPLWLFAIPYMLWLNVSGHYPLAIRDVILNLALLNWFARLPGMTPYWFITAISLFYLIVMVLSRIRLVPRNRMIVGGGVIAICMVAQLLLSVLGIPQGYIFIMTGCGLACFLNADNIYKCSIRMTDKPFATLVIVCMSLLLFWFLTWKGTLLSGTPLCYWASIPIAASIVILAFSIKLKESAKRVLEYISAISYEVYLVHSAMLLFLRPVTNNNSLYLLLFLLFSTILGVVLHELGKRVILFREKYQ